MKKLSTLLALLPVASLSFGQAITITASDIPVATGSYDLYRFDTGPIINPSVSTSATWDYSSVTGPNASADYAVETDAFFTAAGTDAQSTGIEKYLNSSMVYYYNSKIDFNSSGVYENGIEINEQLYDISALTGTPGDSLNIPTQRYIVSEPKQILAFPMTVNTKWFTNGRHTTDFNLTVAAAGIINAPSQHVYYTYRKDSIAGWGKMRVYTPSGPSAEISVLMNKSAEYNVDSFYVGGAPAPATLLSGFGISQGQITDESYRYMFLRKGTFMYLAAFLYEGDNTYTNAQTYYVSKDFPSTGVGSVSKGSYTTVMFPNPSAGSDINLMIAGGQVAADRYTVTDLTGRVVVTGTAAIRQGLLHISFGSSLPAGQYILSVTEKGTPIATEQFSVMN